MDVIKAIKQEKVLDLLKKKVPISDIKKILEASITIS